VPRLMPAIACCFGIGIILHKPSTLLLLLSCCPFADTDQIRLLVCGGSMESVCSDTKWLACYSYSDDNGVNTVDFS